MQGKLNAQKKILQIRQKGTEFHHSQPQTTLKYRGRAGLASARCCSRHFATETSPEKAAQTLGKRWWVKLLTYKNQILPASFHQPKMVWHIDQHGKKRFSLGAWTDHLPVIVPVGGSIFFDVLHNSTTHNEAIFFLTFKEWNVTMVMRLRQNGT